MASRRLFGTDGVRGVAGEFLTAELALGLGRAAAAEAASAPGGSAQVLVIRDTRESGDMLEAAVCAGMAEAGASVFIGGVLPTPAAPLLMERYGLDLGVVISASHNSFRDNGIKFFGADGRKLADEVEAGIEARLEQQPEATATPGRIRKLAGAADDYIRALTSRFDMDLSGTRIALDCAHGATHMVAPQTLERLGATVIATGVEPSGRNINDGVGSTHIDPLREHVVAARAEIGFAFDGDGDRVLAVDSEGGVVDGDELIALMAQHLRDRGELPGEGVAVTVMTNFGFHVAMRKAGIEVATTKVGDRHVLAELARRGYGLGGEQSGHIVNLAFNPTGDGLAAALLALEALRARGERLRAGALVQKLPQKLVNVPVGDRDRVEQATELWQLVEREDEALAGRGRVLVRPSGTEPVVRVMAEAPTEEECDQVCERVATAVRDQLGTP